MGVEIRGLKGLQAKLDKLEPLTHNALARGVSAAGVKVEGDAKMLSPVDTGALRASISGSTNKTPYGAEATIGTNLEYAPHVELGTSKMSAQPYLQPALQKNKKAATKIVINEIKKSLKGL